jgi:glycyl-tRNA synthetase beta chain
VSGKVKSRRSKAEAPKLAGARKAGGSAGARTLPLLVEIGCEEIPARFLKDAQEGLGKALEAALRGSRLLPEGGAGCQTFSTPRRLVARAQVLKSQPDKVEEILGPPVKVAFDAAGKPTRAAESFAQKNGVDVSGLARATTPKGEYLAVRKSLRGLPARQILAELLPGVIVGLSFPKSMYWVAKSGPRFVRPIRWLLALLGEGKEAQVVSCQVAGVRSGDRTRGHRTMSRHEARVGSFQEYIAELRRLQVELDPAARRERVRKESKVLLEKLNLAVIKNQDLEDWVVCSTEWPRALVGGFDERFLHLPREILITVMRDHQKYFAVEDSKGKLQPRFLAILNVDGDPKGLIRAGHERVLEARFSDAEFFWNADLRTTLYERTPLLDGITYQASLGSYADKVRRMKVISEEICAALESQGMLQAGQKEHVLRAVDLCKCDLTTLMVGEFPELQGTVGGLYARHQSIPVSDEVADAIYDHYLPRSPDDPLPRSVVGAKVSAGAVVSLADKLDSVVGGFAVGLEPTGSSDPFALRRAGNGSIKVMVEFPLPISLKQIVQSALNGLDVEWRRPREEVFHAIVAFFEERLQYYLESARGLRYDTVRAVLGAGWDVPSDAWARAQALEKIRDTADFEALSAAAKRIKNILAKSAGAADWQPGEVQAEQLEAGPERDLYEGFRSAKSEASGFFARREYAKGLKRIAGLRGRVDRFFDKVLVMAEDRGVRANRLRLLGKLDELFSGVARLAEIVPAARVDASTLKNSG